MALKGPFTICARRFSSPIQCGENWCLNTMGSWSPFPCDEFDAPTKITLLSTFPIIASKIMKIWTRHPWSWSSPPPKKNIIKIWQLKFFKKKETYNIFLFNVILFFTHLAYGCVNQMKNLAPKIFKTKKWLLEHKEGLQVSTHEGTQGK